jgi:hypothetical protein
MSSRKRSHPARFLLALQLSTVAPIERALQLLMDSKDNERHIRMHSSYCVGLLD